MTPSKSAERDHQTTSNDNLTASPKPNSSYAAPGAAHTTSEAYLEQRLQSQITTAIDKRKVKDNCIFALSNLLKGHPENAKYFIQCDGAKLVLHEIMRLQVQAN